MNRLLLRPLFSSDSVQMLRQVKALSAAGRGTAVDANGAGLTQQQAKPTQLQQALARAVPNGSREALPSPFLEVGPFLNAKEAK